MFEGRRFFAGCVWAGLASAALVTPLVLLELRRMPHYTNFPYPLFGLLWMLPVVALMAGGPLAHSLRTGGGLTLQPVSTVVRITLLTLATAMWIALIADQMPCFLGVPNCD